MKVFEEADKSSEKLKALSLQNNRYKSHNF